MARRGENIRKRIDGRWEGRYVCGRDVNGRRQYRSLYGKTYHEVKEKLFEKKAFCENSTTNTNTNRQTVNETAEKWLYAIQTTKKYSTYIKYQTIYRHHIEKHIGTLPVRQVTNEHCFRLFSQESKKTALSQSTLNSIRNVLTQILKYGGSAIKIESNDLAGIIRSNVPIRLSVFNRFEQEKLIGYLTHDITSYKLGIILCLFTGIRLGEICALETKDISLTQKIIRVHQTVQRIQTTGECRKTALIITPPKTPHSLREIPICRPLEPLLEHCMPAKKYLVNENHPMEPRTYQYMFARCLQKLGLEGKNFHTLRHTFATNCIASGMDPKCLSEILGHSDVQTTLNRYVHPTLEMKQKQMDIFACHYGQICGQDK